MTADRQTRRGGPRLAPRRSPPDTPASQQAFGFPLEPAYGRADFLAAESNTAALRWVERWPDWPVPALVVHGPSGSGKTHLASIWHERAAATLVAGDSLSDTAFQTLTGNGRAMLAVDDADRAPEVALLHLVNACREGGGNLLLTARRPPGIWRPALADLASRLRAALAVAVGPPDDALLAAVLAKHFADRQVRVAAGVIAHLVRHIERSLAAAGEIAAALDAAALRRRGPVSVTLVRQVLAARKKRYLSPGRDAEVT